MPEPRSLPRDLEIEKALLGIILRHPGAFDDAAAVLRSAEDFADPCHQALYRACQAIAADGRQIDLVLACHQLEASGGLNDAGGRDYVFRLEGDAPSAANTRHYAGIVRGFALSRTLISVCTDLQRDAYDRALTPAELLDAAERRIFELNVLGATGQTTPQSLAVSMFLDELDRRAMKADGECGLSPIETGWGPLDEAIVGLHRGEFIVVGARPATGKSVFAVNLARRVAGAGHAVFFSCLEQSAVEQVYRQVCFKASIDSMTMRRAVFTPEQRLRITDAAHDLSSLPIHYDDNSGQTLARICSNARRLRSRADIRLVIVDYLQLIDGVGDGRRYDSRYEEVGRISRGLKHLARELQIPVLALAQLNRDCEKRRDGKPRMSDLRECVVGDTRVVDFQTGKMVCVRDLVPGQAVAAFGESNNVVGARVGAVWPTGVKPVYRVVTASGRLITATANHPLMTEAGWRQVGALAPGDRLAVVYHSRTAATAGDLDACRLLGYFAGNGSAQKHRTVGLIIPDDDAFADAVSIIASRWPEVSVKQRASQYHDAWVSRTYSNGHGRPGGNPLLNWLKSVGFYDVRDDSKLVPGYVFESGAAGAAEFLAGYLATDGCVKKARSVWAVHFDTTSRQLADDVAELCARIGVLASVSPPRRKSGARPIYRVAVSSDWANLLRFTSAVNCRGRKGELLRELAASPPRRTRSSLFTLPLAVASAASKLAGRRDQSKRISLADCRDIAIGSGDPFLRRWAFGDVIWDRIRSIEPAGEQQVYDISVPGLNSFVGNGIVAHNCGDLEQDADGVWLLHKPEPPDRHRENDLLQIIIDKNRNGPTGEVVLVHRKPAFEILELQPGEPSF